MLHLLHKCLRNSTKSSPFSHHLLLSFSGYTSLLKMKACHVLLCNQTLPNTVHPHLGLRLYSYIHVFCVCGEGPGYWVFRLWLWVLRLLCFPFWTIMPHRGLIEKTVGDSGLIPACLWPSINYKGAGGKAGFFLHTWLFTYVTVSICRSIFSGYFIIKIYNTYSE